MMHLLLAHHSHPTLVSVLAFLGSDVWLVDRVPQSQVIFSRTSRMQIDEVICWLVVSR